MNNSSDNPIGIFDSGIGGTSIWKEIHQLLPNEDTIYLADSKNAPYGEKSKEKIIDLCVKNTQFLLEKKCKLIVVACNTATTNAIKYLRATYKVPFIGIEPAIKPASLKTKSKIIGILATKGTLNSSLFEQTANKINGDIKIIEQIGQGLVALIEKGEIHSSKMYHLLESYLTPMLKKGVDCLVLGCTHYPYLIPQIQHIVGNKVQIIDSGIAVAKQTNVVLQKNKLLNFNRKVKSTLFYTNQNTKVLESILKQYPTVIIKKQAF